MQGLDHSTSKMCRDLNSELSDNVSDKYDTAVSEASRHSVEVTTQWYGNHLGSKSILTLLLSRGAPVDRLNRAEGGLCWSTYKAICRRFGCYTNGQGLHDWNAQLAEPMIKILMPGWDRVFNRRLQPLVSIFTRATATLLQKFHRDMESRAQKIGVGLAKLPVLSQQIVVYENLLKDSTNSAKDLVSTRQKDINREFVPVITSAMQYAYEACVEAHGPGSFKVMKSHMNGHVADARDRMFEDSTKEVQRQLHDLLRDVQDAISDKTDEVFIQMKRDYQSVLGGGDLQKGEILPWEARQVRKEIRRIIQGTETIMKRAAGVEVDSDIEDDDEDGDGVEDQPEHVKLEDKAEPDIKPETTSVSDSAPQNETSGISVSSEQATQASANTMAVDSEPPASVEDSEHTIRRDG